MEMNDELADWRRALDACNARLCDALQERARLVREVAEWKRARGLEVSDPAREVEMIRAVRARATDDGLDAGALERIFRAILAERRTVG